MPRKSKSGLLHVKSQRSKGILYLYFDTGQSDAKGRRVWKRLPSQSAPEFKSVYAAMLGHRTRREKIVPVVTVRDVLALYRASAHFNKLAPASQRQYNTYLDQADVMIGMAPANEVARTDIVLMVDKRADAPGAANALLRAVRAMFKWARGRGHVTIDPCADIDMLETGEHEAWPTELVAAALTCDNDRVRLAVHLLYFTAQRIGDVTLMRWKDITDGIIEVRQQKTGRELMIALHSDLTAELARTPNISETIIPGTKGKPVSAASLRISLQEWAEGQGHKVVPHGLRKNAVNALLEAGCSVAETASISGQSLGMVEHYAKRRNQTKLSGAAMLKWENAK